MKTRNIRVITEWESALAVVFVLLTLLVPVGGRTLGAGWGGLSLGNSHDSSRTSFLTRPKLFSPRFTIALQTTPYTQKGRRQSS